jgi:hypothetical protein
MRGRVRNESGDRAPASRRLARYAAQRSNKRGNDRDLGDVRHTLILEI